MKILVCFKTTPIWERVLQSDWEHFSERVDLAYAGEQINCFDESALELALRLKDDMQKQGREVSCAAVTVGALSSSFEQTLFAAGYDDVAALGSVSPEFSPSAVVSALAEYAAQGGYDLILTGKVAGMADTGIVPPLLAGKLPLPLVQDALDVQPWEDGFAVRCQESDGVWERRVCTPLLVSVGNSPTVLRAVTLRARLAMKSREARAIPMDIPADTLDRQFSRPASRRTCTFLSGDTSELAEKLLIKLTRSPQTRGLSLKDDRGSDQADTDSLPPSCAGFPIQHMTPPSSEGGTNLTYPPNTVVYDTASVPWYGAQSVIQSFLADWQARRPDFVLLPDTSLGRQLATGLASATDSFLLTGASFSEGGVNKRVCASNLVWTQTPRLPAVLTMAQLPQGVERISISADDTVPPVWFIGEQKIASASENGLNNPRLVIVCGAGLGSRENCEKARALADRLHAGFGLTRMAALSGWGSPDEIIGQSGATVAPEVCLVLGASGAGAFLVGIENAGKVVAVNTDRNALIFNNADIGIAADAPVLVATLLERVDSQ